MALPVGADFFEGLKVAWDRRKLRDIIKGGYYLGLPTETPGAVPEGGVELVRPYLYVVPVSEAGEIWSNRSEYDLLRFDTAVVYDTFEEAAKPLIKAVVGATKDAFKSQDIDVGENTLYFLRAVNVRYEESQHFWTTTVEWAARVVGPL